jgi:hypothetical protein
LADNQVAELCIGLDRSAMGRLTPIHIEGRFAVIGCPIEGFSTWGATAYTEKYITLFNRVIPWKDASAAISGGAPFNPGWQNCYFARTAKGNRFPDRAAGWRA